MKHTYSVQGMTCASCVQKITDTLANIEGVQSVSVSPEAKTTEIKMIHHISLDTLNSEIKKAGPYVLANKDTVIDSLPEVRRPKRPLKDFLPIIVIALVIAVFTAFMVLLVESTFEFGMRMFMGAFFAIFSVFKLANLKAFADAYRTYDILAMRSKAYAYIYPFLEAGLAILYFANIGGLYRDIFTFILMSVSAIGVVIKLRQKEEIPCACLGMVFVLPMTWVTLIEDVLMATEALIMILLALL